MEAKRSPTKSTSRGGFINYPINTFKDSKAKVDSNLNRKSNLWIKRIVTRFMTCGARTTRNLLFIIFLIYPLLFLNFTGILFYFSILFSKLLIIMLIIKLQRGKLFFLFELSFFVRLFFNGLIENIITVFINFSNSHTFEDFRSCSRAGNQIHFIFHLCYTIPQSFFVSF